MVTPADAICEWGGYTQDRHRAQTKLMEMDVDLVTAHNLSSFDGNSATLSCQYTGCEKTVEATAVVLITARTPNDDLYQALMAKMAEGAEGAPKSVKRIGDSEAPAVIAAAVFSGHRYARELDATIDPDNPLKHDRVFFEEG